LPLVAWLALWFAPRFARAWRRVREQLAELGATFHEDLGGMAVIKVFTREREREAALARKSARFRDEIIWAKRWTLVPASAIDAISGLGAALVLWQGGLAALRGEISTADLLVFILYGAYIYQPVLQLSALSEGINNAHASARRVFELLAVPPDIVDAPHAYVPERADTSVRFDRVIFGYDPARPVLRGLDLEIGAGETVALVGPTGAGKTTTASLVPRFYDVQGGAVLVGGRDVRDVRLDWLRGRIAMVLQDVFLFHGTIRDNLLFGRPDATEAELRAAVRAANADEFIDRMPHGYDTIVGERGFRLSGGQKQRLSIARAILRDAPILILDEPTSSVDVETEGLIQEALARLSRGRTTIVIAHRLTTIRGADRIAVLAGGQVAECDSHDALLAQGGLYAHLYQLQSAQQAWTIRDDATVANAWLGGGSV
jgi:ABC-type multidrug transport system fused ATPase/permease subunit